MYCAVLHKAEIISAFNDDNKNIVQNDMKLVTGFVFGLLSLNVSHFNR